MSLNAGVVLPQLPMPAALQGELSRPRHTATPDVGRELESMFASILIKTMRESMTEDGLFPGDPTDALGSLFDQYMGDHIARGGGLGLAKALQRAATTVAPTADTKPQPTARASDAS